jgi:hypothetical protein
MLGRWQKPCYESIKLCIGRHWLSCRQERRGRELLVRRMKVLRFRNKRLTCIGNLIH